MKKKKKHFKSNIRNQWQLFAMLAVPVLYLIIYRYWPMFGLRMAFYNYNPMKGFEDSLFVGLGNFIKFFGSPKAWLIIKNTLIISVYSLFAVMPFSIALAICMTYCRSKKLTSVVRMVTYFPHFLSTVILVSLINLFFNGYSGMVTNVVEFLTGQEISFLQDSKYYRHLFVWSGVWKELGWGSILYYAALSGVDKELHEAAVMDGATKFNCVWHIDLPTILPTIVVQLIINMGGLFSVGFEKSFLMQNAANTNVSEVLSTYEYKIGIGGAIPNYSYSATVGLLASVVTFLLITVTNRISKKVTHYGLF